MNLYIPALVPRSNAREFAEKVVTFVADKNEHDYADIDNTVAIRVTPSRVEVDRIVKRPYTNDVYSASKHVATDWVDEHDPETDEFAADRIDWCKSLGIDASRIMDVSLHPNYVKVTGFVYSDHEGYGEVKMLRHDGSGYLKYTVDIPIENGDSK